MEKVPIASGYSAEERPGTKLFNERQKRNLLRKRATYIDYFEKGLARVDAACRRVIAFRASEIALAVKEARWVDSGLYGELSRIPGETLGFRVVIKAKVPLKECGRKEKQTLKKYATRVFERRCARAEVLEKKRVARLALKAKQAEEARIMKDRAEAERIFVHTASQDAIALSGYNLAILAGDAAYQRRRTRQATRCRICEGPLPCSLH